MTEQEFRREDFEEDCPRFIPMDYDDINGYYIFDTEKLDYLGFSNLYYTVDDCNKVCDIINTVDYLIKEWKNE